MPYAFQKKILIAEQYIHHHYTNSIPKKPSKTMEMGSSLHSKTMSLASSSQVSSATIRLYANFCVTLQFIFKIPRRYTQSSKSKTFHLQRFTYASRPKKRK